MYGVGAKKAADFGDAFLEAIRGRMREAKMKIIRWDTGLGRNRPGESCRPGDYEAKKPWMFHENYVLTLN